MSAHPVTTKVDYLDLAAGCELAAGTDALAGNIMAQLALKGAAKAIRELHSSATASEKPAWQPIATAPRMRKIIVHYLNPAGKHRTVMACYYEKNSLEMHDDYAEVGTYDAEKDGYFADEGWYEEHDSEDPIMKLQGEPDHWMPLPEPPK